MKNSAQLPFEGVEELSLHAMTLAAACQMAAPLFRQPLDAGTARRIAETSTDDEDDLVLDQPECREGMRAMKSFCQSLNETRELQASNDFHDLFVGPHKLKAAPWSSIYLDAGNILFGPTALRVRKAFATQGFAIPEGTAEPADHVAYELQFLADMQKRAFMGSDDAAVEERLDCAHAAAEFFTEFVSPWVGTFCDRLEQEAQTGFYRGLARFARGLTTLEGSFFERLADVNAMQG